MSKKTPLVDKYSRTLAEFYTQHFEFLNDADSGQLPDFTARLYHSAARGLKTDLACGEEKAAPLIAYLQGNGLGCEENHLKAALWVAIGADLEKVKQDDEKKKGNSLSDGPCQKLQKHINPDFNDDRMTKLYKALYDSGESTEQVFSPGVVASGAGYAEAIRQNKEKYNTATAILNVETVNECIKHFEDAAVGLYVNNEDSKSFSHEDDSCCHCIGCVIT